MLWMATTRSSQMRPQNHLWPTSHRGFILGISGCPKDTSGNAYTHRYYETIKYIPRKVKVVDDTLLFDKNIEETYHALEYLSLCEKNGIICNRNKFQFYRDVVQFGGLQITLSGVTSSKNLLNAIFNFPTLKKITGSG